MHLTEVHIEHFRGIPRLTLPLDRITVVIGENNHGKTSVLDVLGLCLGRPGEPAPTHFRRRDFHRPREEGAPIQPIRLRLSFSIHDRDPSPAEEEALGPALVEGPGGAIRLHLELTGMPDGRPVEARFLDDELEPLDPQPPADTLAGLRRLHPVMLLRFGRHLPAAPEEGEDGEATDGAPGPPRHRERRTDRALEGEIRRVYQELSNTRGPVPADHLEEGLRAARHLLERIQGRSGGRLGPLGHLLGMLVEGEAHGLAAAGSGSRTLALLMVLGALLDVRGDRHLPAEAHPVIAIEEPEVHLHPIVLASAWDVIESLSAQTVVTTHSGELLASVPLRHLRRLVRRDGRIDAHRLRDRTLDAEELRRVGYHVRARRGGVLFSRCWLLVEGETEFWLLRGLARVLGRDLDAEGVQCVEFAQCGVEPLVKLADDLGIEWHLLADGDESGGIYLRDARRHLDGRPEEERITRLERPDVERTLWHHGYQGLYREAARVGPGDRRPPHVVIGKAARAFSKPWLALSAAKAAAERGPDGVPASLRRAVETSVRLARGAVKDGG